MSMKARILLVDDDRSIRESLSKVLRGQGFEVVLAADGQEAIRQFDATKIDLVLLDLNFNTPSEDGWDAFYLLSGREPWLPVVIITGQSNQSSLAAAAGVGAFMEKPLDMPMLLRTVEELLTEPNEARQQRAHRRPAKSAAIKFGGISARTF